MKKALITGITGQDGAYLAELLLEKGYEVHGLQRRTSLQNTDRIDDSSRFILHSGDLSDTTSLIRTIQKIEPDEIYNLGAMSHVKVSFESPEYVADVNAIGTLRILEAIRLLGLSTKTKFYQASTSEMYGKVSESPQSESTPFNPRSPYAASKAYAFWTTVNYREAYGIFSCNGILFNHESPLRGETFVSRKITMAVSKIAKGLQEKLYIGNLNARRDWGHAKDYVEAMWKMLQRDKAEDFVIATGKSHTVRDFIDLSFKECGITIEFEGSGIEERAVIKSCDNPSYQVLIGKEVVSVDPTYFRPTEVEQLLGDATKARDLLEWEPRYSFEGLIKEMMEHDLKECNE